MKGEIKHFFKEIREGRFRFSDRAYIFLFCLLLSTFFWFLSALSDTYATDLKSPLKYSGLADDFILTEEPPNKVEIEVRGSGFELLGEQMSLDRKSIEVDLSQARKVHGNRYFILSKNLKNAIVEQLDPDLELISVSPDTLFLQTQQRVVKLVQVQVQTKISFQNGFQQRGELKVDPNKVQVSGPVSLIDTLQFVETELISEKELDDTLLQEVFLKEIQAVNGVLMKPEKVDVLIPVEKYTEKSIEIPVKVSTRSEVDVKTFPEKVNAIVLVPLSEYNELDNSILEANVEYQEGNKEQKKLKVELNGLPDYAKLIRLEPERVEYIIRK